MSLTNQDYDTLITELINEINAVRNKYDAFSHHTEGQIAEFVHARKILNTQFEHTATQLEHTAAQLEHTAAQLEHTAAQLEQRVHDLAVVNAQRAQIQANLISLTAQVDRLIFQRNKARSRVKFLESSHGYRFEQRLRRLVSKFLRRK